MLFVHYSIQWLTPMTAANSGWMPPLLTSLISGHCYNSPQNLEATPLIVAARNTPNAKIFSENTGQIPIEKRFQPR